MQDQTFYHVTERTAAQAILQEGFCGGWGDVGFGVYFYSSLTEATRYLARGGWDGHLEDPVILRIADPSITKVTPHADWKASTYQAMWWKDLDEVAEGDGDEEAYRWMPARMEQVPEGEYVVTKGKAPLRRHARP